MLIWIDAHLSPSLARWISAEFGVEAASLQHLGLLEADDETIFERAREAGAVVLTKDADFKALVVRNGAPPSVLWLRAGNTSNDAVRRILGAHLPTALSLIEAGEAVVEIRT